MSKGLRSPGIYVDIDSIFDTRLGLLRSISPYVANYELNHGYFTRDRDFFKSIDGLVFQKMYESRSKEILKHSLVTHIPTVIGSLLLSIAEEVAELAENVMTTVYINIYPYDLAPEEIDGIIRVLRTIFIIEVEFVFINIEKPNAKYMKDNVNYIFMYDGLQWLDQLARRGESIEMKDIILHVPANNATCDINKNKCRDTLKTLLTLLKDIIKVEEVQIKYFSVLKRETTPAKV